MFLKETRPRISKAIPYSPQNSPRKSNITINESNTCSFDEIPLEKNRAMSQKKLSVVSINPRNSGAFTKVQSQKNIENNKYSRTLTKQNLQITWKKPGEEKQKYSVKTPTSNIAPKQQYPPLSNITNKPINENYWIQEIFKLKEYFSKQLNCQTNMINTLKARLEQQNRQLHIKEEEIRTLKGTIEKGGQKMGLSNCLKKITDLQNLIKVKDASLLSSQKNMSMKVQELEQKILKNCFYRIESSKCKIERIVEREVKKIDNLVAIEEGRSEQIRVLVQKIKYLELNLSNIEQACYSVSHSTAGSNWEQLSDFVPTFNNNSRMNNFSSMSFADDFFFYPKGKPQQQLQFEQSFSRETEDYVGSSRDNPMSNKVCEMIKILDIYSEPLPCVIDNQKRVVNMLTNEYLIDKEGVEFRMQDNQIELLEKRDYLKILKRYD